jgi:ATP-dependent Clp protease protease subunit
MGKPNKIDSSGKSIVDILKGRNEELYSTDYGKVHDYYISDSIGDPSEYTDWFQEIRSARQTDVIRIHINSPGGDLFTAIQFLQVLRETRAHVITIVEGACMSAATIIFLTADEFHVVPHSMFMFHNYSGGSFGKGGEMFDQISHQRKWSEKIFEDVYDNFLTKAEINSLLDNKDIWMDSDEVGERLKKRADIEKKKESAVKKNRK